MKNKADENEILLNPSMIETEQNENRLFALKLTVVYLVIFWESLRESLTKYNITIWITFGVAMGITMLFAMEGLLHNVIWWDDQRRITRNVLAEIEEDSL